MGFLYRGVHSERDHNLTNQTAPSILPPIQLKTAEVPGLAGARFLGSTIGVRPIRVPVGFIANDFRDYHKRLRDLAAWLKPPKDYEEYREATLIFDDEDDKTYCAALSGNTDLDRLARMGKGVLTFLCPDPFAYSAEKYQLVHELNNPDANATVVNNGTEETEPKFKITFTEDSTFFSMTSITPEQAQKKEEQDGGGDLSDIPYLLIGNPDQVDTIRIPKWETILYDNFSVFSGWSPATSADIDGEVAGTMHQYSDFAIRAADFGTGTGWHGPAVKQALSEQVQDFRAVVWFRFKDLVNTIGRVEKYLQDVNGNTVAKLAVSNKTAYDDVTHAEISVGNLGARHFFINRDNRYWYNFHGHLILRRIGPYFYAHIGQFDPSTGRYHSRQTEKWYDAENKYNATIAAVVLHDGKYADYPTHWQMIDSVKIEKYNKIQEQEIPVLFKAGDVLEIDCAEEEVFLNGQLFLDEWRPGSTFFNMKPGKNIIESAPESATVEITYSERWL